MKFNEFNFSNDLLEGIESMGFETATEIQEKAIPPIIEGRDVMGLAQTGTGKTGAFLLPLVDRMLKHPGKGKTRVLIIVPTRELAMQIDEQMEGLAYFASVSSTAVYGGGDAGSFVREKNALKRGAEMIICTPGRMIAHLNQNYVDFSELECLVLDEADRMLDMGFYEDILRIVSYLPQKRQNLFFSATMPAKMRKLTEKVLNNPVEINIAVARPVEKVLQVAYSVYDSQKLALARHILTSKSLDRTIVFCSTKVKAKQLAGELKKYKMDVEEIHSDLSQDFRREVLTRFKNKQLKVLVATDVISRGIDVENVGLILNYDVPGESEDYIHRIGRTARAEADGVAITFISPEEQYKFSRIEKLLGYQVYKNVNPPEIGQGPKYDPASASKGGYGRGRSYKGSKKRR